jgi:sugar lactone lactonase YvrE
LFIADTFHNRVRRVDAKTKIITTVAGNGDFDYFGDEGPATSASLAYPTSVLVDAAGNVYISDTGNSRVRRVAAGTGRITTIAGNGDDQSSGEGGAATSAGIGYPMGLALDRDGNLYITQFNDVIRKVDAQGKITTVAGATTSIGPTSVAVDSNGNLFIADYLYDLIRRVDRQTGVMTTVAGNGDYGFSGDNVSATATSLAGPNDIVVDSAGNIYISDSFNNRVRAVRGPR